MDDILEKPEGILYSPKITHFGMFNLLIHTMKYEETLYEVRNSLNYENVDYYQSKHKELKKFLEEQSKK